MQMKFTIYYSVFFFAKALIACAHARIHLKLFMYIYIFHCLLVISWNKSIFGRQMVVSVVFVCVQSCRCCWSVVVFIIFLEFFFSFFLRRLSFRICLQHVMFRRQTNLHCIPLSVVCIVCTAWLSLRMYVQSLYHKHVRERRFFLRPKTKPQKRREKNEFKTWITVQLKPTHNYDDA